MELFCFFSSSASCPYFPEILIREVSCLQNIFHDKLLLYYMHKKGKVNVIPYLFNVKKSQTTGERPLILFFRQCRSVSDPQGKIEMAIPSRNFFPEGCQWCNRPSVIILFRLSGMRKIFSIHCVFRSKPGKERRNPLSGPPS